MTNFGLLYLALLCGASVAMILAARSYLRVPPFCALIGAAFIAGVAADQSADYVVKLMALGFGAAVKEVGLLVLAGALIGAIMAETGAIAAAARLIERRPRRCRMVAGAAAGLTGSAPAAFALLSPVLVERNGDARGPRAGAASLALAASATAAIVLPGPGLVAASAILGADFMSVLLWGIGATAAALASGQAWSMVVCRRSRNETPAAPTGEPGRDTVPPRSSASTPWGLALLPVALPLALMIADAIAEMPNEPLGRLVREALSGFGSPTMVLIAGTALALLLTGRRIRRVLAEDGPLGRALEQAAVLVITVGAAGALAKVLQSFGLAEELGEAMMAHGRDLGIVLPFLIAAVIKVLQGSTLVAAITAAGFVQPALVSLGLDGEQGRALTAVAVGAGSLCATHVNDPFYWMVSRAANTGPARTLLLLTVGNALQSLAALAVVFVIAEWLL